MASKSARYWKNREAKMRDRMLSKSILENEREMKKAYRQLSDDIYEMLEAEREIIENEKSLSTTHELNYKRLYDIKKKIDKRITQFGDEEHKSFSQKMIDTYKHSQEIVDKCNGWDTLSNVKDKDIRRIIDSVWCPSGDQFNWSQRLWLHQRELSERLMKDLTVAIETGMPSTEFKKNLAKETGHKYYVADRLYRTENSRIMNQAAMDRYKQAGCSHYRFIASPDEDTCIECNSLDNEVYDINNQQIGVNCPPIHPNCRCTTVAVFTTAELELNHKITEED